MTEGALEMAKTFFSLPIEAKMEVGAQSFENFDRASIQTMQIDSRKTPNFKGYLPLLSGNNDPEGAGDLQEGFQFAWESPNKDDDIDLDKSSGVMAGANVWPSEEQVPRFRQTVLDYQ